MAITYIPINVERLALVAIYQGLDKDGKPQFEQVEEPIIAWRAEVDGEETTITPLIAGYQRTDLGTIRIAIYNYDGTITWNGRQFENLDSFMTDFSALALYMEDKSRD
ncbi:hypothetical protein [Polynucleobacter sp. UK-Gri1-W3]|jgi:hypothetical protein|uniref:hypothetical protein n=1 Tax=Polynucleobacter sp. UK-Gri1-W3 TaxID=1819737 RepID=UPI001C0D9227|nr:hypothetical protein [Polynucleobacter sp. UK-Gri1-W3]MBU3537935.1 hypothetical protein [Polynucleobacter sp. UK-Gri1-W3]